MRQKSHWDLLVQVQLGTGGCVMPSEGIRPSVAGAGGGRVDAALKKKETKPKENTLKPYVTGAIFEGLEPGAWLGRSATMAGSGRGAEQEQAAVPPCVGGKRESHRNQIRVREGEKGHGRG